MPLAMKWNSQEKQSADLLSYAYLEGSVPSALFFSLADTPSLRGISHAALPILLNITVLRSCHRREMQKSLLLPHSYSDTSNPITKAE